VEGLGLLRREHSLTTCRIDRIRPEKRQEKTCTGLDWNPEKNGEKKKKAKYSGRVLLHGPTACTTKGEKHPDGRDQCAENLENEKRPQKMREPGGGKKSGL